jgi:hypothetical protein
MWVMDFERDGAQLFAGAADEQALGVVEKAISNLPTDRPGLRLADVPELRPLLGAGGQIGTVAARFLGPGCRPVRAILFDKSEAANWALGWHQDRTIAVMEKVEIPGFGPWTKKAGIPHVEPPVEVLQSMVTLRVHADAVDEENAPLLIARGSHRFGRIAEDQIEAIVKHCGIRTCLAVQGDIWAYSTLILHASDAARRPLRRRVLQVDYSAATLPGGLHFYGL